MIIESGADLHTILEGSGVRRDELWIVALDHNLRLQEVAPIATITEPITNHIDDIATAIDGEYRSVAYYALAWSTPEVKPLNIEWLAEIDDLLRADPDLRGARLLGQIVSDPVRTFTSVPLCDFSLYSDMADLPRALPIPGPHNATCDCPICAGDRREAEYDMQRDDWQEDTDEPLRAAALDRSEVVGHEPRFDQSIGRWSPDPARAYRRWTEIEEDVLVRSHADGLSCFDISILLKRQPTACARRLNKLGVTSRTLIQSHPSHLPAPPAQ